VDTSFNEDYGETGVADLLEIWLPVHNHGPDAPGKLTDT
jgi:hypothetical protein